MKLKRFLTEESKEEIKDILQRDCSKYLKEVGKNVLYRASKKNVKDIMKLAPRIDRRPRDTNVMVHKVLDDLFKQKYGWNVRSNGIFVSADPSSIFIYGKPYTFFPIGDYKYVWSPKVRDLTTTVYEIGLESFGILKISGNWKKALKDNEVMIKLKRLVLSYKTNDLLGSPYDDTEIVFNCKEYYLVREGLA